MANHDLILGQSQVVANHDLIHGIALTYKQAWRGKERYMAAVRGSFEEDYRLLPQYCDQIKRSNLGSIALVLMEMDVVDDNWMWFLSEIHNLLETNAENMPRLTILSNREKGIVDAVELNFPTAFHGFCMHYLSESFRNEFNNTVLSNIFCEAARSLTTIEFETKILEIEDISQEAAAWVRSIHPHL